MHHKRNSQQYIESEQQKEQKEIKEINDIELEKISKSDFFDKFYYFTDKCFSFTFNTTVFLFKISGMYILWIILHYFSAHLYIKFCVPDTVVGFIMSPFMISTPHCQGLRWVVYNAANTINHMWILIGTWIYSIIWILGSNKTSET
jgi:hypothetical protein